MDIGKLSLFANLKAKMGWLTQRQEVVAQNIANGDTPGYRPRDLKVFDEDRIRRDQKFRLLVRQTNAAHAEGSRKAPEFKDDQQRRTYESAPTGNAVVLEEQLVKLQENQIDYQTMTRLYAKQTAMFKTAIGRGR